ncbi:MAG TPA: NAD(P)/FAD-dependent oxidoreductase [Jatrophihabitantaceae bacterium]|jgi:2-polyprenyl-6-methoxyphenol hydroxylase-like FAD-dependent oxidoreductase
MYDAIIVGARCAGAPTAMLLARHGYRVLLVDRAEFPSDTVSTHVVQAPAVAALYRWGLLDDVVASGAPPIETYSFDFGPVTICGTPRPAGGISTAYAPRRTVLDAILVDAAVAAGAELRERFSVEEYLIEDGAVVGIRGRERDGAAVIERARVVIGADGRNSQLARVVGAPEYSEKPKAQWAYYTYFRDLPVDGFEICIRPYRGWAAAATNDGLTMLVMGWPHAEADAFKADPEANLLRTLDLVPAFAERVRAATRVERITGASLSGYLRKPYGPGWVLVGDAAYNKDPITAQGIIDAFRDAESVSRALHEHWSGAASFAAAMAAHHAARDAQVMPIYEFTSELARLEPPPPELQHLLGQIDGNQAAMDAFVSINAGTVSPAEFFDPTFLAPLLAA